jgi:glycosyltransferase involved in cell wall biosynthesis
MEPLSPDVVIYVRALFNGGIDRVMLNLIEEFLRWRLNVTLLVDFDNIYSPFRASLPAGLTYVSLEARGPFARFFRLRRYLLRANPRSMVSAGYFPNVFAILAKIMSGVRTRLVVTEHNSPSINRQSSRLWEARRWFLTLARAFFPYADGIVAVSKGVAADLAQQLGLPAKRVECIYNPVVNAALYESAKEEVAHPWFNDQSVPVIMALGRLEPQKNFALLIRAFAELHRQTDCRLVIFGDGSERDMLQELILSLNLSEVVELHGFVKNPHPFTARASMLVLSSVWEGLSIVLIEALALGTPVVSTDCHFGPSEVLDGGKYGTLVPVGDQVGLTAAMLAVLQSKHHPQADEWIKQFSSEDSASRYLKLLLGPVRDTDQVTLAGPGARAA